MSDADTGRWQGIVERETLGEPISSDDAAFRGAFEAEHPACAAETAAWGELLAALDPGEGRAHAGDADVNDAGDDDADAIAAKILGALRGSTSGGDGGTVRDDRGAIAGSSSGERGATSRDDGPPTPVVAAVVPFAEVRRRRALAISAAALMITAAAASLALWWAPPERPTTTPGESIADATPPGESIADATPTAEPEPEPAPPEVIVVAMSAPQGLVIDGSPRGVGLSLGEGSLLRAESDACLLFRAPFAAVCVDAGSEARIVQARGGAREIALDRGRLVATLDPMGPGQSFTVTTTAGGARAIGTVFAVAVDGPAIDVGVVEGKIEVRKAGAAAALPLSAGEAATIGDPTAIRPMDGEFATWSVLRSELASLWRSDASALLSLEAASAGALTLDDVALPTTAVDLLISADAHTLDLRGPRGEARSRSLRGDPAAPVRLGRAELEGRALPVRLRPTQLPDAAIVRPPATATGPTIADLRREAADARSELRWGDAADAYRSLIDAYPDAPAADNARYQLGDLLRARLGRPAEAITLFDAYIAGGGPLTAEARVGRIRGLQQLGRRADEAAAIAEFLAHHGDHLEAAKLRQRARELASP